MKTYDLIIIGTGPAGLTAAIYAARYNLNTLVIGKASRFNDLKFKLSFIYKSKNMNILHIFT